MSTTKKLAATLAAFGWPPIMRMEVACRYAVRSRWTLQRAVEKGELAVAGKQGRSWTFLKEDLDRWLLGPRDEAPQGVEQAPTRTCCKSTARALSRLATIKAGGEP